MLNEEDRGEAVARWCSAVGNLSADLLGAGVDAEVLAAGLRIEAGKIERARPRQPMAEDDRELVDLARRGHEFINSLQVAGIDERAAVVALGNVLIERVARTRGAAGAAHWLRGLATLVDRNGDAIEEAAQAHRTPAPFQIPPTPLMGVCQRVRCATTPRLPREMRAGDGLRNALMG